MRTYNNETPSAITKNLFYRVNGIGNHSVFSMQHIPGGDSFEEVKWFEFNIERNPIAHAQNGAREGTGKAPCVVQARIADYTN